MAKCVRRTQFENKTVTRHFAMKWSTSARVDFYLLERQTRACSYEDIEFELPGPEWIGYMVGGSGVQGDDTRRQTVCDKLF